MRVIQVYLIYREVSNTYQSYDQTERLNTLGEAKAKQHSHDVEVICV